MVARGCQRTLLHGLADAAVASAHEPSYAHAYVDGVNSRTCVSRQTLRLQVRMNLKRRAVELRTCELTSDAGSSPSPTLNPTP